MSLSKDGDKKPLSLFINPYDILLRFVFVPIIRRHFLSLIDGTNELLYVLIPKVDETLKFGTLNSSTTAQLQRCHEGLSNEGSTHEVIFYLHNPIRFCVRLLMDQKIGLGEAFMYADWDAKPSAKHFLTLLIRAKCYKSSLTKKMVITSQNESNVERKEAETGEPMAFSSSWKNLVEFAFGIGIIAKKLLLNLQKLMLNSIRNVVWLWNYAKHRLRENTMLGSAKNIHEHYDLGNELFEMFLDSSFTYSCALFDPIPSNELIKSDFALLETAQRRKYDKILTEMQLKSDDHVLEIGCGWGSCGLYAVEKYGCKWTGITISKEQLKIAQKKVEDAKLGDRIEYKLLDYRLEKGVYDKVLAIEMIEAVGHEYLPEFFRTLSDRLRPGGLACLQAITCPDAYYDRYRRSSDFIKKYIFPGGHLPSEGAIKAALPVQLTIRSVSHIGKHYSKTLDLWHAAWMEREKDILKMGYSKEFHRKWQFYFVLCSALFEYDHIDTVQMCITRH